jgi:MYXO-CTERM domain-containing protein
MKTLTTTSLIVTALLLIASPSASAALLTYEGFDYANNAFIGGLDGGTGWGGPWGELTDFFDDRNNIRADAALSYTDGLGNTLPTTGLGHRMDRSFRSAFRPFGQRHTSGVHWFSILMQPTNGGPIWADLRDDVGPTGSFRLGRADGGSTDYGISFDGQTALSSVSGDNSETRFFLVRYAIGSTVDDGNIHLFIDPDLDAQPDLSDADAFLENVDSTEMPFDIFVPAPGQTSSGPPNRYDEIRLSTDFFTAVGSDEPVSGAIPEPTALGVLGLGALALLRRR